MKNSSLIGKERLKISTPDAPNEIPPIHYIDNINNNNNNNNNDNNYNNNNCNNNNNRNSNSNLFVPLTIATSRVFGPAAVALFYWSGQTGLGPVGGTQGILLFASAVEVQQGNVAAIFGTLLSIICIV